MSRNYFIDKSALNITEKSRREDFIRLFKSCPIPRDEILRNLGLFINRQSMSRILFMHDLYKKILTTQVIIIEFGTRWGQNLALFESFRGMYEPFNFKRKIVAFDTFEGFKTIDKKDGNADIISMNAYSVSENYETYLEKIMDYHESESPISHVKKFELIKGDASETCKKYFDENPQTIVALAYFDMDVYKPTKDCLEIVKKHLVKGSILGFDELSDSRFPGETLALKEVFDIHNLKIQRDPLNPDPSFIIME